MNEVVKLENNNIVTTKTTNNTIKYVNKILTLVKCDYDTVRQEKLVDFLASKPNFAKAIMIRKGREIMRKDLVGIEEGPSGFLTDIFHPVFAVTPSRRCIVVKEDLLCNGEGNCRRKCGGLGACILDCPKKNERAKMGHRCSFKVLLTMHSDQIGLWEVKMVGTHIEPEFTWMPPAKKSHERKSHSKALKMAKKALKNKNIFSSIPRVEWQMKQPIIPLERKKTPPEFLMQSSLADLIIDSNTSGMSPQINQIHQAETIEIARKETQTFEFQNTDHMSDFHNSNHIAEFSNDDQQTLNFQKPEQCDYFPDDNNDINNIPSINISSEANSMDNQCLEEQLLEFHRIEHQQRMSFLSEEHQAKMEVISIEKDIALFKRQKLMNEMYSSAKCDNITLSEQ